MDIFLVRHGESASNVDPSVHLRLPDHTIPLTEKGKEQARQAASIIQNHFRTNRCPSYISQYSSNGNSNTRLWYSPYLRTRQTAEEIKNITYWDDETTPKLKWKNAKIVTSFHEDVALCEQQFGLFDGLSDDELQLKYPEEYSHYKKCEDFGGRFWARMPLGESRFDVTQRVHQMFGTWQRDLEKHNIDKLIVVSHGVTIRAIIMRWLHLPFEWFEQEPNPKNCSVRLIENGVDKGYL